MKKETNKYLVEFSVFARELGSRCYGFLIFEDENFLARHSIMIRLLDKDEFILNPYNFKVSDIEDEFSIDLQDTNNNVHHLVGECGDMFLSVMNYEWLNLDSESINKRYHELIKYKGNINVYLNKEVK